LAGTAGSLIQINDLRRCPGDMAAMDRGQIIPISQHPCPGCGRPMLLVSAVPRFGAFPELQTFECKNFECKSCGVTYTEAAKPNDDAEAPRRT